MRKTKLINNESLGIPWKLSKLVLPQHTDHAGVMWHGTYVNWFLIEIKVYFF